MSFNNVNQPSGCNDFINSTFFEGTADNICPFNKFVNKIVFTHFFQSKLLFKNFSFRLYCRILLIKCSCKSIQKCFIQNVRSHKTAIRRTFTFCICSSNNIETVSRIDNFIDLFEIDRLTFHNRLEAHNFM